MTTYDAEKVQIGGEPISIIEIDMPVCRNCFGSADSACQATAGNLAIYSEQINNSAWWELNGAAWEDVLTAYDGTLTLDEIIESTDTTAALHYTTQAGTGPYVAGENYVYALDAQTVNTGAGRGNPVVPGITQLVIQGVIFDLSVGAVISNPNNYKCGIIPIRSAPSDLYSALFRCWVVAPSTVSGTQAFTVYFALNGATSYIGTGRSIGVGRVQIAQASTLMPYTRTTSATVAKNMPNGQPCFNTYSTCQDISNYNDSSIKLENGDTVSTATPAANMPTTVITVEAVVMFSGSGASQNIIQSNGATNPWFLGTDASGALTFTVNGEGPVDPQPAPINEVLHVVGTYDGSAARYYLDGAIVYTVYPATANYALDVAGGIVAGTPAVGDSCTVFSARVYDRVLSAEEILRNYKNINSYQSGGAILDWALNEGTGSVATDYSGNGNTGTFAGSPTWDSGEPKTYRFAEQVSGLPPDIDAFTCLVGAPKFTAGKIRPGNGIGDLGIMTFTAQDFAHHDRGIDPYVECRTYDPSAQGTFFGKFLARNPYFANRQVRQRTGYVLSPWDWGAFQDRLYLLDSLTPPDSRGAVTGKAKGLLKLANDDVSQCPAPSNGQLAADITAAAGSLTLTPTGIGDAEYSASGVGRIGDEVVTFTRAGDVVTLTGRNQYGTSAAQHSAKDTFQECKVYTSANVVDIIYDLLTNYAGIDAQYIDYDAGLATPTGTPGAWDIEKDAWLSFNNYSAMISKPVGVKTLLKELTEQGPLDLHWDEAAQSITLKAFAPPLANATLTSIGEDSELIADSVRVKIDESLRYTEVWVFWGQVDYSKDLKEENCANIYSEISTTAESSVQYGKKKVKKIISRWLVSQGQAAQVAGRFLARFGKAVKVFTFKLDAKDDALAVTDIVEMNTKFNQAADGSNEIHNAQLTMIGPDEPGHTAVCEAISSQFYGNYGFIGPDTLGDYSAESQANKRAYAFIGYDGANFPDGEPPYKII